MKYYIGIDGGGTKTAFRLEDEESRCLAECILGSASHRQIQAKGVVSLLKRGIENLKRDGGLKEDADCEVCFGMPLYGEFPEADAIIAAKIKEAFPLMKIHLVNDVCVGWAGGLELKPGIHLVSGTGSIVYGRNEKGASARAGGWSERYSDEGSCYWLGIKMAECFTKEADGRFLKGPLYKLVRQYFEIREDTEFIAKMEALFQMGREHIAALQKLLLEAARQGDPNAQRIYEEAARELSLLVKAVGQQIFPNEKTTVTYSGGLFWAGEIISTPLKKELEGLWTELRPAEKTPVEGAVLMAKQMERMRK